MKHVLPGMGHWWMHDLSVIHEQQKNSFTSNYILNLKCSYFSYTLVIYGLDLACCSIVVKNSDVVKMPNIQKYPTLIVESHSQGMVHTWSNENSDCI